MSVFYTDRNCDFVNYDYKNNNHHNLVLYFAGIPLTLTNCDEEEGRSPYPG